MTKTAVDPIEALRAIADAGERARKAADLARSAQAEADAARPKRDAAALVLYRKCHWKAVDLYRALGVSRGRFVGMVDKAPDRLPRMSAATAEDAMVTAAATVHRCDALASEAREVRDEAAEGMMNGRYRKPDGSMYRNADVARLTDLTTARIAQIRQGTR